MKKENRWIIPEDIIFEYKPTTGIEYLAIKTLVILVPIILTYHIGYLVGSFALRFL